MTPLPVILAIGISAALVGGLCIFLVIFNEALWQPFAKKRRRAVDILDDVRKKLIQRFPTSDRVELRVKVGGEMETEVHYTTPKQPGTVSNEHEGGE
jgi:hypothetical protein